MDIKKAALAAKELAALIAKAAEESQRLDAMQKVASAKFDYELVHGDDLSIEKVREEMLLILTEIIDTRIRWHKKARLVKEEAGI